MRFRGWLLDPYTREKDVVYWFKTVSGDTVQLRERCRPSFIAEPADANKPEHLVYLFDEHPYVYKAEVVERHPSLDRGSLKKVVEVTLDLPDDEAEVLRYAERLPEVKEVYNTGLIPIQWHLIRRSLPPTSYCEVEARHGALVDARVLDDWEEIEAPPFKPLMFIAPSGWRIDDVKLLDGEQSLLAHLEGDEEDVLRDFNTFIAEYDPDVLITDSPTRTVRKIVKRATRNGVRFQFGRGDE
ncbi:hypothetical protein JXL21_03240, partial [Candidatus Bathyarchaeota archaeon]|nr:hypothetical protein [Candidatus Bathyarchaeota archaeon]